MESKSTTIERQELRTTDGEVFAYLVPAAEIDRMRGEIETLREQVATLQRQKSYYVGELTEVLQTYIPIPPTEEELLAAVPNAEEITRLIADVESR